MIMNRYDFLKLVLVSIMIGTINFFMAYLLFYKSDGFMSAKTPAAVVIYSVCMTFFSIGIFFLKMFFLPFKFSDKILTIYYFYFLLFSLVGQFIFLQYMEGYIVKFFFEI